jgi:small subunit ribosomal protein S20
MAKRIKSGLKRRRQDEVRRVRNRAVRTRVRHAIRTLRAAVDAGDEAAVKRLLPETVSVIDVSVRKGVLHRNTASRYKSRLANQVSSFLQAKQE